MPKHGERELEARRQGDRRPDDVWGEYRQCRWCEHYHRGTCDHPAIDGEVGHYDSCPHWTLSKKGQGR